MPPASELTQNQREFLKTHKAQIIKELQATTGVPVMTRLTGLFEDRSSRVAKVAGTFDDRHYCRECKTFEKATAKRYVLDRLMIAQGDVASMWRRTKSFVPISYRV
jgi:hypothetical protein